MQSKPSILEYKNFQSSLDKLNNFSTILGTFLDVQGKEEAEVADLADRLEKVK